MPTPAPTPALSLREAVLAVNAIIVKQSYREVDYGDALSALSAAVGRSVGHSMEHVRQNSTHECTVVAARVCPRLKTEELCYQCLTRMPACRQTLKNKLVMHKCKAISHP